MFIRTFFDRALAVYSYLIGCEDCGEAIVIDPLRDPEPYLETAEQEDLRITHVTETHIHADFVSGAQELVKATGAKLSLSGEGGADWQYTYANANTTLLHDGSSITFGGVEIKALHLPGHTPELLVFQIRNTSVDVPFALITGDSLFVGSAGRPDLLETASGVADSAEQGARDQYRSMARLRSLPDHLLILPGHGAGSACGKSLSHTPTSTLGYEKRTNPALSARFKFDHSPDDVRAFTEWLLADQPETPRYFARMKQINREGPALLETLESPPLLEGFILPEVVKFDALVIDARPDAGHLPGTLRVPPETAFSTYVGAFLEDDRPVYLIAAANDQARLIHDLRAIGVDTIAGVFPPEQVAYLQTPITLLTPEESQRAIADGANVIDVRAKSEYDEEHLPGAIPVFYANVPEDLPPLDKNAPVIVQCASGVRSQIALSRLINAGFTNAAMIEGGIDSWRAAGLPTER